MDSIQNVLSMVDTTEKERTGRRQSTTVNIMEKSNRWLDVTHLTPFKQ